MYNKGKIKKMLFEMVVKMAMENGIKNRKKAEEFARKVLELPVGEGFEELFDNLSKEYGVMSPEASYYRHISKRSVFLRPNIYRGCPA